MKEEIKRNVKEEEKRRRRGGTTRTDK